MRDTFSNSTEQEFNPAGMIPLQISDAEFSLLRDVVYKQFGINLTSEKKTLVIGRLQKVLKQRGLNRFEDYHSLILADQTGKELSELVDNISTNHTFFNREKAHFDFFVQVALPSITSKMKQSGDRDLRIWCAASSTGEEPYTLAILLREYFGHDYAQWDGGLLATDISDRALGKAKFGHYTEESIKQLPEARANKWFHARPGGMFEADAQLKKDITYRRFNLVKDHYPFKKKFHAIFCRNVMIYFDPPTKDKVMQCMAEVLNPGGYFFLGHSETLGRDLKGFKYLQPAVYQRI